MTFDLLLRTRAKDLRNNATVEEAMLWQWLKRKNINGVKFRRQHILNGYIVDFYAPVVKLVVELDGGNHRKNKEYDKLRDKALRADGCSVLRFWNGEIRKNMKKVVNIISKNVRIPGKPGL